MNQIAVFLVSLVLTSEIVLAQRQKPAPKEKISSSTLSVQSLQDRRL